MKSNHSLIIPWRATFAILQHSLAQFERSSYHSSSSSFHPFDLILSAFESPTNALLHERYNVEQSWRCQNKRKQKYGTKPLQTKMPVIGGSFNMCSSNSIEAYYTSLERLESQLYDDVIFFEIDSFLIKYRPFPIRTADGGCPYFWAGTWNYRYRFI